MLHEVTAELYEGRRLLRLFAAYLENQGNDVDDQNPELK